MGNLRSVEKALEHVGADGQDHERSGRGARRRRADPARRRRLPEGDGASPRARDRRAGRRAPRGRRPGARHLPRPAAALRLLHRARRRRGPRPALRRVDELRAEQLKVPHIGWSPVRWEQPSPLIDGIEAETPFYFVHSLRAPAAARAGPRDRRVRRALRLRGAERPALRRPVPSREVERRRTAAALQLRRASAPGRPPPRDPLSGDRHPRRAGGAAAAGRLRARDRLRRRPASTRRGAGSTRAPRTCTSSTSTAPAPARPQNLDAVRRIAATVEVPIQVGGGLRDLDAVAAVLDAGAERAVLGTAALRDPELLAAALDGARRADRRLGRRARRAGRARGLDRGKRRRRRRLRSPRLGGARREALRLHADRGRRHDGRARPRGAAPGRRAQPRRS